MRKKDVLDEFVLACNISGKSSMLDWSKTIDRHIRILVKPKPCCIPQWLWDRFVTWVVVVEAK